MEVVLNVKKASVYDEVAKLTGYIGAKDATGEVGSAYDRVFTTDDDRQMLERFWRESCNATADEFKKFIVEVSTPTNSQTIDDAEVFTVKMNMPESYDIQLTPSIESNLFSYFVNSITSKWFAITNRGDVEYYRNEANLNANEIRSKIYYRIKPVRVVPQGVTVPIKEMWNELESEGEEQINPTRLKDALKDYSTTEKIGETLKGYPTSEQLTESLKNRTTTDDLNNALKNYPTTETANKSIEDAKTALSKEIDDKKPKSVSELANDSNYATADQANKAVSDHNASTESHADIRSEIQTVKAIAQGASVGYPFDTVDAMNAWLAVPENVAKLKPGNSLFIRATDVPDYWWDGTKALESEAAKVDLSGYITKTETEQTYAKKADVPAKISQLSNDLNYVDGKYVTDAKKLLFIDLWNQAAGSYGMYNEETGFFELNGLADITYEEAVEIYNVTNYWTIGLLANDVCIVLNGLPIRTNLPLKESWNGSRGYDFGDSVRFSDIVILNFASLDFGDFGSVASILQNSFSLPKCTKIIGNFRISNSASQVIGTIGSGMYMPLLEEWKVSLAGRGDKNTSIEIPALASLNLESLTYMVTTSPSDIKTALTIVLHPDAYARLTDDLIQQALAKNITFSAKEEAAETTTEETTEEPQTEQPS